MLTQQNSRLPLTQLESILRGLSPELLELGRRYKAAGNVYDLIIVNEYELHASVDGFDSKFYRVEITSSAENAVRAGCSCTKKSVCGHIVAAMYACLEMQKKQILLPGEAQLEYRAKSWIESLTQQPAASNTQNALLFILSNFCDTFKIQTYLARSLQKGGFGKPEKFFPSTLAKKSKLSPDDIELATKIFMHCRDNTSAQLSSFIIGDGDTQDLLESLIATHRCYYLDADTQPLTLSKNRSIEFEWVLDNYSKQTLQHNLPEGFELLVANPLWYINTHNGEIGRAISDRPSNIDYFLAKAPPIHANQANTFIKELTQALPSTRTLPLPKVYKKSGSVEIKPIPCIAISAENKTGFAELSFRYGKQYIDVDSKKSTITGIEKGSLINITRNFVEEAKYIEILDDLLERGFNSHNYTLGVDSRSQSALKDFFVNTLPILKAQGFEITLEKSFPYSELLQPEEWYSDLHETSDYDWFEFEMGVVINGKKTNLLPILIDAIKNSFAVNDQTGEVLLELPDRRLIKLPEERFASIMQTLKQFLFRESLTKTNGLRLHRQRAALLAEIDKAFTSAQLRWFGATKLLALGKKLRDFSGIKTTKVPKKFKATLRPYQQHGVDWLQFLREYNLCGILADDMGLGKTIQTLAHLTIEKSKSRLTKPTLIIAPTSVISNWKSEIATFSPYLKTLVLHGTLRKEQFSAINDHDLVITTYPLLVRDKDALLAHDYYYVILDEAQTIKNSQAKMTQIVQQFKTEHRLCLTGTPMENHLGELWSLFHFLLPGMLGTPQQFRQHYRTPIEKEQNVEARRDLAQLIRPYLLRRTKQEVVTELPEKTEIIETISLDTKQQDLYETIRLAMDKKIRDVISQRGIERSRIIILDALLKLRQICCDPRLLKSVAGNESYESAKLNRLLEMLPEMLEQGRRILLFSQFTSMLSLIEAELKTRNIDYVKLTGNTVNRDLPISQFQSKAVPLFLISLKAGGTGLNLTAADTVIHYDPWWNPAVENQATDRAHRIGQTNPVFVYKLITEHTIEEKILKMQRDKSGLLNNLLDGQGEKSSLTSQDIMTLLD